jgi:hypothetical protein
MFDMVPDDELNYTFKFPTLTVPINLGAQTYEIPVNINSLVSDKSTPTVFGNDDPGNFLIDGDALTQMIMNSLYDLGADTTQYKNEIAQFSDSIASSLEVPKIPGVNFSFAPLAIPQVGFGLPWNADIVLRWMPSVKISDDVGEVGFFGIGARYCISQYIPMSPIDISAFAGYQTLWVGDFLDFSTFTFGAMAGRSFPIITPYLGLAFENTKVSVDYTLEDPIYNSGKTADISMDISGDNKFRATLGVKMGFLGIINLHAAYNIGKHNQLTAGLGIGFN